MKRRFIVGTAKIYSQLFPNLKEIAMIRKYSEKNKDGELKRKVDPIAKKAQYFNHWDIKQRAIQVFYTEETGHLRDFIFLKSLPKFFKVLNPNGKFRSTFDMITVIWVLVLVFFIPFEIGFDWYKIPKPQKMVLTLLDVWFAIDIILNFRTGYIYHGTVIMDPKKVVS